MHFKIESLSSLTACVCLVSSLWTAGTLAVPTPWTEGLLDEINSMRARGMSEGEIASRYPRFLSIPSVRILTDEPAQYPTIHELYPSGADDVFIIDEDDLPPPQSHSLLNAITSQLSNIPNWGRRIDRHSPHDKAAMASVPTSKLSMTYSRALRAPEQSADEARPEVK